MSYQPQTIADVQANLNEQLEWRVAERDDEGVAQSLYKGETVDAVYTLDETGLLDGFFGFLEKSGVMKQWQEFHIEAVKRVFLPTIYFVLLYGVRVLLGIESSNGLPGLLFSNLAMMSLIGFTAYQVANGLTLRGQKQRIGKNEYVLMDPQTLAETICKSSAKELEGLFNGTIHCLAAFGVFMVEAMVAVDGTAVVTPASYTGCGCQKVINKKHNRSGVEVKEIKFIFGWRLIVLVDLVTLIPLAIKVVHIQSHEAPYLLELVKQAQENLSPYSRIRILVVDRAYVDGASLYALNEMGIKFVVIAKTKMKAYRTALRLSQNVPQYERVELKRHGHGQEAGLEERVTRVSRVTDIRDWDAYRPAKQPGKRLSRKNRPGLNAVVVRLWHNQVPTGEARVYLTNMDVTNPWVVIDAYDDRSWIENGLFRTSKQFWQLTRWFPQRNDTGVRAHLTFVMLMIATATAYRLWQKKQSNQPHQLDDHQISQTSYRLIDPKTGQVTDISAPMPPSTTHLASSLVNPQTIETDDPPQDILAYSLFTGQGTARWRRELKQQNRDKVIVFVGHQYGIFNTNELMVLFGVPIRTLPPHLGSPTDILRHYGCLPNSP